MVEKWERQKGERDASYIYFEIYLKELKHTPKKLQDVIDYIENLTEKDGLRLYKNNLIEVPTNTQLQNHSRRWNWQERETAYINHLNEIDEKARNQKFHDENDEYTDSFGKDLNEWDEYAKELKKSDYSLSTKIRLRLDIMKGKDIAYKNYRLGNGRSTNISESNDKVKVDADINYGGFENLVKALDETRKQHKRKSKG